ncbi:MAG: T9SS type A sorting domain-containing protein [Bacteroidota bacterium]
MKKALIVLAILALPTLTFGQGRNNTWLLGNDPGWPNVGRIIFDSSSYQLLTEQRKMPFKGTQATISDDQGNFLMSSNGVWIANAINDTMMNGSGLNPSYLTNSYPNGIPLDNGNIIIPFPGDSSKYVLFHMSIWGQFSISLKAVYKSVIDISLDGGLGAVIQKNDTIISDTLSWGITACKHGNGRDWWVVFVRDGNPEIYKMLITPNGVENITTQSFGLMANTFGNVSQLVFSQDGTKFIYCSPSNQMQNGNVYLADFDRCTGMFSNIQFIPVSSLGYLYGLAFSPSGEFIYACTSGYVFQINSTTLSIDTIATYDGFISGFPPNCCATSFWSMYLAANGKVYITSGSSVQHLHEMNYPDSAGVSCDVQQHTIALGNYFHLRAVPNHPNYYLGPLTGSPCDTLTNLYELTEHDFRFSVSPNPNNGEFKIMYLLPQNQKGKLEVFDVNGRKVYEMNLPKWSTMQVVSLPESVTSGVYNCVISSADKRVNKKIAVLKE